MNSNKYPFAKPFDIVRTIMDTRADVSQLQIQAAAVHSVPPSQVDVGTHTLGNVATTNTPLSFAWTIYANDANVGTVYEIEVPIVGTMGSTGEVFTLGAQFDGTGISSLAPIGTTVVSAVSHGFGGIVNLKMTCTANGSSGAFNLDIGGGLGDTTLNRGNSPGQAVVYGHGTVSLDTTVDHTVSLAAFWAATATGETISGVTGMFTRQGP